MSINYRKIKSFGYKLFVSVLCAFILVFSYEVNKPKAIAPLIVWGGSLLAGIVVEEAIEMGIRNWTTDGKTKTKSKTGKVAKELIDEFDDYDWDFTKDKPTKKKDGSLVITPSAHDRAKIARKVADEFDDVIDMELSRTGKMTNPKYEVVAGEGDPFYNTSVGLAFVPEDKTDLDIMRQYDFFVKFSDIKFTPIAYGGTTKVQFISSITGANAGYYDYHVKGGNYVIEVGLCRYGARDCAQLKGSDGFANSYYNQATFSDPVANQIFSAYLKVLETANAKIHQAEGIVVPSTLKNVYPAPKNMPKDFKLPNEKELSNKPIVIPNIFPPSDNDTEISWEEINNQYIIDNSMEQKFEEHYNNYIENTTYNETTNNYNNTVVNNYYTDITYVIKAPEIEEKLPVPKPDGDDLPAEGGGTADPLDRSMLSYIRESYEYLGDSIDNNLKVMKDVVDDAGGVVDFLDESFDWLPAEWRAYFGAAFILGVVAHFFRR